MLCCKALQPTNTPFFFTVHVFSIFKFLLLKIKTQVKTNTPFFKIHIKNENSFKNPLLDENFTRITSRKFFPHAKKVAKPTKINHEKEEKMLKIKKI